MKELKIYTQHYCWSQPRR